MWLDVVVDTRYWSWPVGICILITILILHWGWQHLLLVCPDTTCQIGRLPDMPGLPALGHHQLAKHFMHKNTYSIFTPSCQVWVILGFCIALFHIHFAGWYYQICQFSLIWCTCAIYWRQNLSLFAKLHAGHLYVLVFKWPQAFVHVCRSLETFLSYSWRTHHIAQCLHNVK